MKRYLLADFKVDIENEYDYIERQCAQYQWTGEGPTDFHIHVTAEERRREQSLSQIHYPDGYLESICAYRKPGLGNFNKTMGSQATAQQVRAMAWGSVVLLAFCHVCVCPVALDGWGEASLLDALKIFVKSYKNTRKRDSISVKIS